jgi:hypothetical protein
MGLKHVGYWMKDMMHDTPSSKEQAVSSNFSLEAKFMNPI